MAKIVKIAILGGGGILAAHAPGFIRLPNKCEVVAVAEPNVAYHDRIREWLQKDVPIYGDYREALAIPGLDAVDIILPHSLHKEATVLAAEKGLHVLCEKVMARNTYECQIMVDACRKAGVELVIAHDRRYSDGWAQLKNIIEAGTLGDILFIKMEHNQNVEFSSDSWGRSKDLIGGGAVMSCLTHQIDALRWYLGEVDSVTCMTKTVPSRMEGECIGIVSAKMKSGSLASLAINWYTQSESWQRGSNLLWYEFNHVCGTLGEAYYMHGKGAFVKMAGDEKGFTKMESVIDIPGHQRCIEEFVKKICGEPAEILTPGYDSLKTVEVAEAAYLSEATGRTVELPIKPVPWEERKY